MVELAIAIMVAGLLMSFATPKLRSIRNRNNLKAAKNQLAAMLGTARAAAIQRGRESRFRIVGNVASVVVDTSSVAGVGPLVVVAQRNLKDEFGATVKVRIPPTGVVDTIVPFDARGFASTRSQQTAIYSITVAGAGTDSLCVSRYGLIAKRECLQ